MSPSAVTVGGLVLDIGGAVILALGLVLKTPEQALDETTPRWDFNASLDASFASQTADAQVGAGLLVAGFGVQMAAALGWHESSWSAVGIALGASCAVVVGAWLFLHRYWRSRRIVDALYARMRASGPDLWWPALAAFGQLLGRPWRGDSELIADYAVRLIGRERWTSLIQGVDPRSLIPYTRPRSEIPGTAEYEASHRASDSTADGP